MSVRQLVPPQSQGFGDQRQLRCFQPEKYNLRALASGWEQRAVLPWRCLASFNSSISLSLVTSTLRHRERPVSSTPHPRTHIPLADIHLQGQSPFLHPPPGLDAHPTPFPAAPRPIMQVPEVPLASREGLRSTRGVHSLGDRPPRSLPGSICFPRLLPPGCISSSFINQSPLRVLSSPPVMPQEIGKGRGTGLAPGQTRFPALSR